MDSIRYIERKTLARGEGLQAALCAGSKITTRGEKAGENGTKIYDARDDKIDEPSRLGCKKQRLTQSLQRNIDRKEIRNFLSRHQRRARHIDLDKSKFMRGENEEEQTENHSRKSVSGSKIAWFEGRMSWFSSFREASGRGASSCRWSSIQPDTEQTSNTLASRNIRFQIWVNSSLYTLWGREGSKMDTYLNVALSITSSSVIIPGSFMHRKIFRKEQEYTEIRHWNAGDQRLADEKDWIILRTLRGSEGLHWVKFRLYRSFVTYIIGTLEAFCPITKCAERIPSTSTVTYRKQRSWAVISYVVVNRSQDLASMLNLGWLLFHGSRSTNQQHLLPKVL